MSLYETMKAETLGNSYDVDGYYGRQCWDFVMYCASTYLGGAPINCGITGYVQDIATQKDTNGILNWCTEKSLDQILEQGDICIWAMDSPDAPYSHIAFYDYDDDNGNVYFLGQNQPYKCVNISKVNISGIIAVFRPNAFINEGNTQSNEAEVKTKSIYDVTEHSAFTVGVEAIKIRKQGSLSGEYTGVNYEEGQTVYYDIVSVSDGYCWISWIGAQSGERRFMAVGPMDGAGNFTEVWGTFS